jgi:hypothetical protein
LLALRDWCAQKSSPPRCLPPHARRGQLSARVSAAYPGGLAARGESEGGGRARRLS